MYDITHGKAHVLLQAAVDGQLGAEDKSALEAHLSKCGECCEYAESLKNLEVRLRKVLRAQWDELRPALDLQAITQPSPIKLIWNNLLNRSHPLGKVSILAALLLGYFVIANLFGLQLSNADHETPTINPSPNELSLAFATSPTPSAQASLTGSATQVCKTTIYVVQTNDTLESIAFQHGTTKEAILELNDDKELTANLVFTGTELVIPMCKSTPFQTATIAITPLIETIYPTQPE